MSSASQGPAHESGERRTLERVFRKLYLHLRGENIADEVPAGVLLRTALARAPTLLRGSIHQLRYSEAGGLHLRGARTTVAMPGLFRIGRAVVLGESVRIEAYSRHGIKLGDHVTVGRGAALLASGVVRSPGEGIEIGDHSSIGMNNIVWGQGGVTIGNDCLLGPNVTLISENHQFRGDGLIRTQGVERGSIHIGDNCWLAAGVTVTAGVTIGAGCVVGAGAVVVDSIPPDSVAVGVPARVVSSRVESPT